MTKYLFLAVCMLAFATTSSALASKQEVLDAIAVIKASNDGDALSHAIPTLMTYVKDSDQVVLLASPETMPWVLEDGTLDKYNQQMVVTLLTGNFAAGCVEHQLKIAKSDRDPYEGWVLVLARYEQVRSKLKYNSPGIDRLRALAATGKLKEYAHEIAFKK